MNILPELPDKPSELLRVALTDLKKCEEDDRYGVDMGHWHMPNQRLDIKPYCLVCLSGAVMGKTLGVDINRYFSVSSKMFDGDIKNKLSAINFFRVGEIRQALTQMGLSDGISSLPANLQPNVISVSYTIDEPGDNRDAFYESMEFIIKLLEGANL